jgi:hypothetical protein
MLGTSVFRKQLAGFGGQPLLAFSAGQPVSLGLCVPKLFIFTLLEVGLLSVLTRRGRGRCIVVCIENIY